MGRVEFKRPWPTLQAHRLCPHGGQEGRAGGIRSLPCWPCRAAAVAAVRTRMVKALRARPPLGQRNSPRRRRPQREGGGGVR